MWEDGTSRSLKIFLFSRYIHVQLSCHTHSLQFEKAYCVTLTHTEAQSPFYSCGAKFDPALMNGDMKVQSKSYTLKSCEWWSAQHTHIWRKTDVLKTSMTVVAGDISSSEYTAQSEPGTPHSWRFYITHSDTPESVGVLRTSDHLVTETSTWQNTTLTTTTPAGFEPAIPARDPPQTLAVYRSATGIGTRHNYSM